MDGDDADYFDAYDDFSVHELMLKDAPRTLAYKHFVEGNPALFKDKVVVDVGAGTGILSLFAAKAGAKHVYAIEASASLARLCQQIASHNGYADRVTVLQGRAEDVAPPAGVRADVLISEWMGFYLLHESMLRSVVAARDRWLAPGGVMVPAVASLYLCPVSLTKHRDVAFWRDVYGFDYAPLRAAVEARRQPSIMTLETGHLLAEAGLVARLELAEVESEDVERVAARLAFTMTRHGVVDGFACWFDVEFVGGAGGVDGRLSTAPGQPDTHWQQTVMRLPQSLMVSRGEQLACRLELTRDPKRPRRYDICIEIEDDADDDTEQDDDVKMEEETDDAVRDLVTKAMNAKPTADSDER